MSRKTGRTPGRRRRKSRETDAANDSGSNDRDWARIETVAVMRGMTAAELVRSAAIAAVGDRPAVGGSEGELTAQIDRIFRYVHIMATAMRNDMLRNGRGEELEELVRSARALQGELKTGRSD